MDDLDRAFLSAWDRLAPAIRADRLEATRRALRRSSATLSRPIRPWCLSFRASDFRLAALAYIDPADALDRRRPHSITLFSDTLRRLAAPVHLDWPGIDWTHAAALLGRHPESLRYWIARGYLRCTRHPATSVGKRGKPVPFVWSPTTIDPNADFGRGPDPHWGSLWKYLHERIPDDLAYTVKRVPIARADRRGSRTTLNTRHGGWQFICPGLASLRLSSSSDPATPARTTCGRATDRLFLPFPPWTYLDALGEEPNDPLDITFPFPTSLPLPRLGGAGEVPRLGEAVKVPSLACHHCHRIRYASLVGRNGWNLFVAHLTAGLLYGHEVPRPADLVVTRKRRYVSHTRPAPRREQIADLLGTTLTAKQIAARLGISVGTVNTNIKALYRKANVHTRAQFLATRPQTPMSAPAPQSRGKSAA